MHEIIGFLLRHGYAVLFLFVFAEQAGLPLPAVPMLLAAGTLSGVGKMSFGVSLSLAVISSLAADLMWYELGKVRGFSVLRFLCRIALEPDSCVRSTETVFEKQGARTLLAAKFVPGLSTVAPPLAGAFKMRIGYFLLWDGLGSLVWAGTFIALGLTFSNQIELLATHIARAGTLLVTVIVVGGLALYITWKHRQRRKYLRELRIARIAPEELKEMLDAGQEVTIVDVRSPLDVEQEGATLPGALYISASELSKRYQEIPRDRDVILYCT